MDVNFSSHSLHKSIISAEGTGIACFFFDHLQPSHLSGVFNCDYTQNGGSSIVKPTVLYFDDERALLDIFEQMFSDEYEVHTASTHAEARQVLSSCGVNIIISDWSMPDISGIDFLREAREACPDSFRIILTGYGQVGDAIGEISAGLVELFITKPWAETDLRRALQRAVQTRGRRKKHFSPRTGDATLLIIGLTRIVISFL